MARRPVWWCRTAGLCRADHIVVLAGGKVAAEGTLAEVLVGSTEFRHMWEADASAR